MLLLLPILYDFDVVHRPPSALRRPRCRTRPAPRVRKCAHHLLHKFEHEALLRRSRGEQERNDLFCSFRSCCDKAESIYRWPSLCFREQDRSDLAAGEMNDVFFPCSACSLVARDAKRIEATVGQRCHVSARPTHEHDLHNLDVPQHPHVTSDALRSRSAPCCRPPHTRAGPLRQTRVLTQAVYRRYLSSVGPRLVGASTGIWYLVSGVLHRPNRLSDC